MSVQDDRLRTRRQRIGRLRKRIIALCLDDASFALQAVLKGILDLLEDEL